MMIEILPLLLLTASQGTPVDVTPLGEPAFLSIATERANGLHDVRIFESSDVTSSLGSRGLEGIRFLPIDFAGHTRLTEMLPGRPRLRTDVPGAGRLELEGNWGSLYRYERPLSGSKASVFGYLWVGPDGEARSVLERPGTGPEGNLDPTPFPIAVGPTSPSFLFTTTIEDGGELFEVHLARGTVQLRTGSLPPIDWLAGGLALCSSWGSALASEGALRFDRSSPGAEFVPFPGAQPVWFANELATSADETAMLLAAGNSPAQAETYRVLPTGSAQLVSSLPFAWESPTLAVPAGPSLALSGDGSLAAWRSASSTREIWTKSTATGTGSEQNLTGDTYFVDTLDDAPVILFQLSSLLVLVGEREPLTQTTEGADLFRVELAADGSPTSFTNLSGTSGNGQVPFTRGELKTEGGLFALADYDGLLLHQSDSGGGGRLLAIPADGSGLVTILDDARELELFEQVGDRFVWSIRTSAGPQLLLSSPTALDAPPVVLSSLPEGTQFTRPAAAEQGWLSLVVGFPGGELLSQVHPSSGQKRLLDSKLRFYGPTIGRSLGGGVSANVILPRGSVYGLWYPGRPAERVPLPKVPGFHLPGN